MADFDLKMRDLEERKESDISPSKLLNYVRKAELQELLTPIGFANLQGQLQQQLGDQPTLKDIKQYLSGQEAFIAKLKQSEIGDQALQRYQDAVTRLKQVDRDKLLEIRKGMIEPRRRYVGCLATKLKPEDYRDCLDNYDSSEFDTVKLIPSALKQRVFQNTRNDKLKAALAPSINNTKFSDIPSGLRHYINSNPGQFQKYYEERRQEMNLIKAVLNNLSGEEKASLSAYYAQNKSLPRAEFAKLFNPENVRERKRVRGKGVRGGIGGSSSVDPFLFQRCLEDLDNAVTLRSFSSEPDLSDLLEDY